MASLQHAVDCLPVTRPSHGVFSNHLDPVLESNALDNIHYLHLSSFGGLQGPTNGA